MKASLVQCKQKNDPLRNKEPPFQQNQQLVKDQIEQIQQKVIKNDYEPMSEMFKIEVTRENQEIKFKQESNPFQLFKQQPQEYLFTKDNKFDKRPLKNGGQRSIRTNFDVFFKDLKKNSSFPQRIRVNTIVLARGCDVPIWPAKIVKVQSVKTSYIKSIILFKVDFINLNMTLQSSRSYLAQFTPQNIEKVKKFITDKKLFKALKIAQKMFLQDQLSALKTKNCQISVKKKQFPSKISNQFKNDLKIQPINIVIETPRIKLQQNVLHDESQADSDQQIKDNFQKYFHDNETQYSSQENLSKQKIVLKDEKEFIKNQPKIEKPKIKKQFIEKSFKKTKSNPKSLKILNCLRLYRRNVQKKINKNKKKFCIENILNYIAQPLQNFKIEDFQRYAYIIDILIYLCTIKEFNLEDQDQDKQFIKEIRKILSKLYVTLRDYEGDNRFINGVKMLQLCKLKVFQKQDQKNVKIVD